MITRHLILLFALTTLLAGTGIAQDTSFCPPCSNSQPALQGHGAASDGRRTINIAIDANWGDPLSRSGVQIRQVVNKAIEDWNNSIDSSGNFTYYHLTVGDPADIIVRSSPSPPFSSCGYNHVYDANHPYPHIIDIKDLIVLNSVPDAAAVLEHEFGHSLGLANAASDYCYAGSSIMQGANSNTNCITFTKTVQASDVAKSNQNCTAQASCNTQTNTPASAGFPCPQDNNCGAEGFSAPYKNPDNCGYSDNNGCSQGYVLTNDTSNGQNCCQPWTSPIIFDLTGDGYFLTDSKHGVMFDLFGTGDKWLTSWTESGRQLAFLVLDRDGDGIINSGKELFGNYTSQPKSSDANGFLALQEFDKPENGGNGDGKIDASDLVFKQLQLWIDENHDGISESSELLSLSDWVVSISLSYEKSGWFDAYGNNFAYRSKVTFKPIMPAPPNERWSYDVFLVPITF